jgi:hypothetical protein
VTGAITPSAKVTCEVPPAVNAIVSVPLKNRPTFVSPVLVNEGALAVPSGTDSRPVRVTVPVSVGAAVFAFVATAVAILLNSVSISEPFTILPELPEGRLSFAAKLVVLV